MNTGLNIKKYRERANLTQLDLAKKIGTHKQVISEIERGKHEPGSSRIVSIARALGVTVDELVDTKTPASGSDAAGDMVPGLSISREMAEALERLPADDVDLIVRTIREFVLGPREARTALESLHALIQRLKHAKQDTPPLGRSAP